MVTVLLSALWWAFARRHFPRALAVLSVVALGLAAVTLALEGLHWQLVPWQVLAIACAAAATLRWWRPGHSRRWSRAIGRVGVLAGVTLGGVGLLFAGVPSLPRPTGQHLVGSTIFHWTDPKCAEVFTDDPQDRREVVAQAWYPMETPGPPVPYFEAQGKLPAYVDPFPGLFYGDFDKVDTHASASPPVSSFVLDQLGRLAQVEPASPLVGHLDVQHTGIVGHSMGGAAAAQVVAEYSRFLVGVNLDGTLPAVLAAGWHLGAPFLWLQSDGQQQASYLQVRDRLLAGVPGSELLVVGGTSHTSFTDLSTYWSPLGRGLMGDDGSQALARHPTVRREQGNAAGGPGGG